MSLLESNSLSIFPLSVLDRKPEGKRAGESRTKSLGAKARWRQEESRLRGQMENDQHRATPGKVLLVRPNVLPQK